MKARKVMVELELKTDIILTELRNKRVWEDVLQSDAWSSKNFFPEVHQVSAQVVKEDK